MRAAITFRESMAPASEPRTTSRQRILIRQNLYSLGTSLNHLDLFAQSTRTWGPRTVRFAAPRTRGGPGDDPERLRGEDPGRIRGPPAVRRRARPRPVLLSLSPPGETARADS